MIRQAVAMVAAVNRSVVAALVGILVLQRGLKGLVICSARTYLGKTSRGQEADGKGRPYHYEPNKGTGTRQHRFDHPWELRFGSTPKAGSLPMNTPVTDLTRRSLQKDGRFARYD